MTEPVDPREWLRDEERQIAKLRRTSERSRSRISAVTVLLWIVATILAACVVSIAWHERSRVIRRLR